jgi:DNA-binding PadR family transcriptional regulator
MLISVMIRTRRPSRQMLALLQALAAQAPDWCHGYELMKATGLASGTIYPLLMRMTDQGFRRRMAHARAARTPAAPCLSPDHGGAEAGR